MPAPAIRATQVTAVATLGKHLAVFGYYTFATALQPEEQHWTWDLWQWNYQR
jgi:hypothetical protein